MPTNLRVAGEATSASTRGQRLLGGMHRVGAGGPEDAGVGLGDGADLRRLAQAGADRHHAGDAGGARRGRRRRRISPAKSGKSRWQWLSTRAGRGMGTSCGRRGRQAAWARASAAAASICSKVSRITWAGSRLTARACGGALREPGREARPRRGPAAGVGARRAAVSRSASVRAGDGGAGAGQRQAGEGGGDELERQLVAGGVAGRRRPRRARARGGGRAGCGRGAR